MIPNLTAQAGAQALKAGKIVAYPTEAVFGLGCDPHDESAVRALLDLKNRPTAKGLILIASAISQILPYIDLTRVPAWRWTQIQNQWPGPHTWVFPCAAHAPASVRGPLDTVAIRVTAHPTASALANAFGAPLISTSANLSDQPPITNPLDLTRFGERIAGVVEGGLGHLSRVTSVQDAVSGEIYR